MSEASDPNFKEKIFESFSAQIAMKTIGAELLSVEVGIVQIKLPYQKNLTQQHGYLHAGIVTTIVDSACGYAAYTLMPAESNVLTIEFKSNFIAPAIGDYFIATGRVVRAGRTISVCQGDVFAYTADSETQVSVMQATMMTIK